MFSEVGESRGAIGREILPGLVDDLARQPNTRDIVADDFLRTVARPSILNHHEIDQATHGFEATRDDLRLILDDHAQTNGRHSKLLDDITARRATQRSARVRCFSVCLKSIKPEADK